MRPRACSAARGRERAHIFRKRWFRRGDGGGGRSAVSSDCSDLKRWRHHCGTEKRPTTREPPLRGARPGALRKLFRGDRRRAWVATARRTRVSGSEREGERGRSDARRSRPRFPWETPSDEADVPPGLWQFAGKKLREAYSRRARRRARPRVEPATGARRRPRAADPDPEPGVRRVLSAIRDLAVASAGDVPAANARIKPKRIQRSAGEERNARELRLRSVRRGREGARGARAPTGARRRRFSSTTFPKTKKTKPRDGRSRDARFSNTSRTPPRASAERSGARRPSREGTAT